MLTQPNIADTRVRNVEWNQSNAHDQQKRQSQAPVEVARARLHDAYNLEDNQLKHGHRQGKCDREDELHQYVAHLIVPEQVIDEEPPAARKKTHLQMFNKQNSYIIPSEKQTP